MPVIPQTAPRQSMSAPQLQGPAQDPFGRAALSLNRRSDGPYEETEATRLAGEANLDGVIKIAYEQYGDPDEYAQEAASLVEQRYNAAVNASPNPNIRAKIESKLAKSRADARDHIALNRIRKKTEITLGNWDKEKVDLAAQYVAASDEDKPTYMQDFEGRLFNMARQNVISPKNMDVEQKSFGKNVAALTMEVNPSLFAKQLSTGMYDKILDPVERLTAQRSANELVRQGINDQERELKAEGRKADSVIQQMLDDGTPLPDIEAKLKEYSRLNVMDSADRTKWQNRLKSGETKDTPSQVQNANTLLAGFKSQYYTYNSIQKTRAEANAMWNDGRLGPAGASQVLGFLNQTQSHLGAEGRAMASAARAAAGGSGGGKGGPKVTDAQAKQIINENFPYDRNNSISKAHRDDITRYNDMTIGRGEVDKAKIARDIRDDRARVMKEQKARNAGTKALTPDEAAAMKALRGGQ